MKYDKTFKKEFCKLISMGKRNYRFEKSRISLSGETGDTIAEITFPETEPGVYTIDHTFVDGSLRGQGIAAELVQLAVEEIERLGGTVMATCSYAAKFLQNS